MFVRLAVAVLCTVLASGCAASASGKRGVYVGLVTDIGGLGDHSFNDSAHAGLLLAAHDFGLKGSTLQSRSAMDYQPNLMTFANEGADEIFSIGYDQGHDLSEVAERYPHEHFAIVDSVVDEPNVTSVTFKSEEGSFLAGALAAMTTKTKTIAFLGGMDIPLLRIFEAGYIAGAREVDPSVRVLVKYIGDFNDVAGGNELAGVLYNQGADIIYVAAGKAGLGAIQELRQRSGVYAIGVDSNQDALAPGKILTSVLKRIDRSVLLLSGMAARHQPRPQRLELGLAEDAVGLTDFHYTRDIVTAATRQRLDVIRAALIAKKIVAPSTRAELAEFVRVPL